MFGLSDLVALVISAFIILPVVVFIREAGYLIVSACLLYTSPSPRDRTRSRMPSSA